jgi:hypothetical protein
MADLVPELVASLPGRYRQTIRAASWAGKMFPGSTGWVY